MAVRARTNVAAVMSRLRVIAGEVDPSARLTEMMTLDAVGEADLVALDFFARLLAGVSIVAMILATAGVYALMSFTVARRTAEIGIRVALGANPRRIVTSTFARALTQVTIGLVLGRDSGGGHRRRRRPGSRADQRHRGRDLARAGRCDAARRDRRPRWRASSRPAARSRFSRPTR